MLPAAVELVLTLRLVFHLALRQAEAFSRSVLRLLGLVSVSEDGCIGARPKSTCCRGLLNI